MDEIWQRHKAFILQCVIGGIVFLIAWGVKANMYDRVEDAQATNERAKTLLKEQLSAGKAPSRKSIAEQERLAKVGQANFRKLAASVASVAEPADGKIAYVRENIGWVLSNIGKQSELDSFVNQYRTLPQGCLFRLKEEARGVLVGRAAQLGKTVDRSLGLATAFTDDEVPVALHGLALATEIVTRALNSSEAEGIDGILDMRIAPRQRRKVSEGDDASRVNSFPVAFRLLGHPEDVHAILRSFNRPGGSAIKRLIVLDAIEGISRPREEEVTIDAQIRILGLHHLGVAE